METTSQSTATAKPVNPILLTGDGYGISITPDAEKLKESLLVGSRSIAAVTDAESDDLAKAHQTALANHRLALEKCRKEVKEPVLQLGKDIDQKAAQFGAETLAEENRIKKLRENFAADQARKQREAAEVARREAAEAERKRQEAERAERLATEAAERAKREAEQADQEDFGAGFEALSKAEEAAEEAKRAEQQRLALEAEQRRASAAVIMAASAPVAKSEWDFEVTNIHELYLAFPDLVTLTPKRSEILARLKALKANGAPMAFPGLKISETFKASR